MMIFRAIFVTNERSEVNHKMNLRSFTVELGRRLRVARREARKTQEQAGAVVDVSASTVGRWERGDGSPTMAQLYTLARFYKKPLRELSFIGPQADYVDISELPSELQELVRTQVDGLIKWTKIQPPR